MTDEQAWPSRRERATRASRGVMRPRAIYRGEIAREMRLWCRYARQDGHGTDGGGRHLPTTRGECRHGPRPCPYVTCRYHLGLDVTRGGSVYMPWPQMDPWEVPETCALDAAEQGPRTLDEIGALLNITRERVRQIQAAALAKIRAIGALKDH